MRHLLILGITASLLFTSCGSGEETTETVVEPTVENCLYTYNPAMTKLDWTAYKFLRKAGVGGTFTTINVEGNKSGANPRTIIESLSFSIPVNSVETNDPGRNKKIDSLFFGTLNNTSLLSGEVVSLNENGKAVLRVTMNDITNDLEGDYTLEDNVFTFNTEINVENWNAQAGIISLNEACKDLHTDVENGDTESKLWSDVTISFSTELTKKCD
jgi:polyisoprenoid-binding protein YceI